MTRPVLGSLELWETAYSGFAYPARVQVVPILAADADEGGNGVVQGSALTLRQATISWVAPSTAERDTAAGYYESLEEVTFVDRQELTRTILVIGFSSAVRVAPDHWDCTATLVELVPPVT